jgi:hypothetical protein
MHFTSCHTPRRLAAIVGAALALGAVPAAAQAQPLTSVAISTQATGNYMVLDVAGGSTQAGANVVQWLGHGGANQRWNPVPLPRGGQHIVNPKSGMCLAGSHEPGASLFQWYCNDDDPNEQWYGTLY